MQVDKAELQALTHKACSTFVKPIFLSRQWNTCVIELLYQSRCLFFYYSYSNIFRIERRLGRSVLCEPRAPAFDHHRRLEGDIIHLLRDECQTEADELDQFDLIKIHF